MLDQSSGAMTSEQRVPSRFAGASWHVHTSFARVAPGDVPECIQTSMQCCFMRSWLLQWQYQWPALAHVCHAAVVENTAASAVRINVWHVLWHVTAELRCQLVQGNVHPSQCYWCTCLGLGSCRFGSSMCIALESGQLQEQGMVWHTLTV